MCVVFHLNRFLFNDVYVWGFLCLLVIQSDIKQSKCCIGSLGGKRELTLFFLLGNYVNCRNRPLQINYVKTLTFKEGKIECEEIEILTGEF